MRSSWLLLAALAAVVPGCTDDDHHHNPVSTVDTFAPAAPRGLYSTTGDHEVTLRWLDNTESDVEGYRVYQAPCAGGSSCPYDLVAVTGGGSYTLTGLVNGVTRFYAVAAYDHAGNESDLSYETVYDTPRPAGVGLVLGNYLDDASDSGYDFSAYATRRFDDIETDVFFGFNGSIDQMFVPDTRTDIQDAGVASSLDAVDFAPGTGWSPTGTVELILGHCYVVWTRDDHYAKFRVTAIVPAGTSTPRRVSIDWAYQIDPGNGELRARPVRSGEGGARRPVYWAR